jgi:hypothetical protein
MINLFLSIAIFLNFVPYFIKGIIDNITFLKKNFRNNIKNRLKNILKRNCKNILIANTFINSNQSFDKNHSNY